MSFEMIKLTIDNTPVEVEEGTTVLQAAAALGIEIPTMCYLEGHTCHPSCMVCMVKDAGKGNFFPSCAMPAAEGMNIIATSDEVYDIRREALELLLSDHVGDCEAPCTLTCPAGMDIPLMNRLIANGEFEKSLEIVRQEIALPLILGYICPAPCEKACRRKPIDGAVSICLLKRFTAQDSGRRNTKLLPDVAKTGKKINRPPFFVPLSLSPTGEDARQVISTNNLCVCILCFVDRQIRWRNLAVAGILRK